MIDPNASDWSDLDLLTHAEVNQRVADEISVLEAELANIKNSSTAASSGQALQDRIDALRRRIAL